jgi:hypothetical protein
MLGTPIVSVALGIIFIYLILSLFTTAVNEAVATLVSRRAKFFEKWLKRVLGNPDEVDAFFSQPMIRTLWDGNRKPAYLQASAFAHGLLGRAVTAQGTVAHTVDQIHNEHLRKVLADVAGSATAQLSTAREALEAWFDMAMDRVSGWYKRRTHLWVWVIALAAAFGLNADTLLIARTLWSDPVTREAVAAQADAYAKAHPDLEQPDVEKAVAKIRDLNDLRFPIGWTRAVKGCKATKITDTTVVCDPRAMPRSVPGKALRLAGLFVTAAALTLGAPFWFDLLSKVTRIRAAGANPDDKPKP